MDYLEQFSPGKRREFFAEISHCMDILTTAPLGFPLVFSKFRKMVMPHQPYNIYYSIKPRKKEVIIARVWHQKRNPKKLGLK